MSRLVINKGQDRTICIIKNFGSIELSENKIKIIDKFGLTSSDIFSIDKTYTYSVRAQNFDIRSSNAYSTYFDGKSTKYWCVSSQALDEIVTLVGEYYDSCIANAVRNKEFSFDEFTVSFKDNYLSIKYQDFLMTDKYTLFKPLNYGMHEIALLGEESYIYIIKDSSTDSVVNLHIGDTFPKFIYRMLISIPHFNVLDKFITDVRLS